MLSEKELFKWLPNMEPNKIIAFVKKMMKDNLTKEDCLTSESQQLALSYFLYEIQRRDVSVSAEPDKENIPADFKLELLEGIIELYSKSYFYEEQNLETLKEQNPALFHKTSNNLALLNNTIELMEALYYRYVHLKNDFNENFYNGKLISCNVNKFDELIDKLLSLSDKDFLYEGLRKKEIARYAQQDSCITTHEANRIFNLDKEANKKNCAEVAEKTSIFLKEFFPIVARGAIMLDENFIATNFEFENNILPLAYKTIGENKELINMLFKGLKNGNVHIGISPEKLDKILFGAYKSGVEEKYIMEVLYSKEPNKKFEPVKYQDISDRYLRKNGMWGFRANDSLYFNINMANGTPPTKKDSIIILNNEDRMKYEAILGRNDKIR